MSRETQKGTWFEGACARYLADFLGRPIERRAKEGTHDRGDIAGVRMGGRDVVVECKNHRRTELPQWLGEAERERGNANASYAVVVHKRPKFGEKNMGGTYVTMTLETFAQMLRDAG